MCQWRAEFLTPPSSVMLPFHHSLPRHERTDIERQDITDKLASNNAELDQFKHEIVSLFSTHTIDIVQSIMWEKHRVQASLQLYCEKLQQWGVSTHRRKAILTLQYTCRSCGHTLGTDIAKFHAAICLHLTRLGLRITYPTLSPTKQALCPTCNEYFDADLVATHILDQHIGPENEFFSRMHSDIDPSEHGKYIIRKMGGDDCKCIHAEKHFKENMPAFNPRSVDDEDEEDSSSPSHRSLPSHEWTGNKTQRTTDDINSADDNLDRFKRVLISLYSTNTLETVQIIMRESYGIDASCSQYRMKLSQWGFYKRNARTVPPSSYFHCGFCGQTSTGGSAKLHSAICLHLDKLEQKINYVMFRHNRSHTKQGIFPACKEHHDVDSIAGHILCQHIGLENEHFGHILSDIDPSKHGKFIFAGTSSKKRGRGKR